MNEKLGQNPNSYKSLQYFPSVHVKSCLLAYDSFARGSFWASWTFISLFPLTEIKRLITFHIVNFIDRLMRNNACLNIFPKNVSKYLVTFFLQKNKVFCLLKPLQSPTLIFLFFTDTHAVVPFATASIFCRKDSMQTLTRGREMLSKLSENVLMDQF